jgi:hypothetical protein
MVDAQKPNAKWRWVTWQEISVSEFIVVKKYSDLVRFTQMTGSAGAGAEPWPFDGVHNVSWE